MKTILMVDAVINLVLGVLLLLFSARLAQLLGVPGRGGWGIRRGRQAWSYTVSGR